MTTSTTDPLERIVRTLLYEGYALYPYTRAATKNATPTPFGIVYPPAYAATQASAFSRMQVECVATDAAAEFRGEVRFLQASGQGHQAVERRVEVSATPMAIDFDFDGLCGHVSLSSERRPDGRARVTLRVENTTPLTDEDAAAMARAEALMFSMLSTHLLLRTGSGSFVSPLERGDDGVAACCNVNTWPVLVSKDDDAILGPTIMLPDHPQIAPESVNDFFDGTEIEEALVLHVQTLTDAEREDIAGQDPVVREMLARAAATTPEQLMDLHGRVRLEDPPGERQAAIGDAIVCPGDKVILSPGVDGDVYDKMLHGRTATVHRIFVDYDDRVHFGVTVDDDPMNEILRESGRFLFFFAEEVQVP